MRGLVPWYKHDEKYRGQTHEENRGGQTYRDAGSLDMQRKAQVQLSRLRVGSLLGRDVRISSFVLKFWTCQAKGKRGALEEFSAFDYKDYLSLLSKSVVLFLDLPRG